MRAIVRRSKVKESRFNAPPSKSYTHRAYAVATLAIGESVIKKPLRAGDTDATLKVCRALGAEVEEGKESVKIKGTMGRLSTPEEVVDVENSGTTIRLFTSIAALNGNLTLTGDKSVQNRPMQPLLDALSQLGVKTSTSRNDGKPPVRVIGGGIDGGKARIRGDISSQFISSLLIAAPYARKPVEIELKSDLKSRPYVDLTIDIMQTFGVEVENSSYKHFKVPTGHYISREYEVEGDYSSSSYLLALAALSGSKITVERLNKGSAQGDTAILGILSSMGAEVKAEKNSVTVKGSELKAVDVELAHTPDLLPTVSALATAANGRTRITNIAHARLKETDRIAACAREFARFGATIEEGRDYLIIEGLERPKGGKVNSYGDHRMAMALAILACIAEGATTIEDAESVNISYPGFFKDLKSAGVEVEVNP